MKKNLLYVLLLIFFWNCVDTSTLSKEDFIGTWNDFPIHRHNEITFYKDSAIIWDLMCSKSSATWKLGKDSIHFDYIQPPPDADGNAWALKYQMNPTKDSLTFSIEADGTFDALIMKVEDDWMHYLKGLDMNLELPEAGMMTSLTSIKNDLPELYLGWKNQKLAVRVGYDPKEITQKHDLFMALYKNFSDIEYDTIYPIVLIADKNIPVSAVDSIKNLVRDVFPKNLHFYRVQLHDAIETHYGRIDPNCIVSPFDWEWHGRWEE